MKWLSSTTFSSNHDDEFKKASEEAYLKAREKWHGVISRNNGKFNDLIDTYFNTLYLVITKDGEINLPKATR